MSSLWKEIIKGDTSTYPPENKELLYKTYWSSISRDKILISWFRNNEYGGSVDGTFIKTGDKWIVLDDIK